MRFATVPDIPVFRRRDTLERVDERRLRRGVEAGTWVRVAPGSFVQGEDWTGLLAIERHRVRVREGVSRLAPGAVIGMFAAAALWDIDVLGPWPATVDVIVPRSTGGRSHGNVRRHALGLDLDEGEALPWGEHLVTTPERTALDLARASSFVGGVAVIDQARWTRRAGGPLTTLDALRSAADRRPPQWGVGKVARALEASESLADTVRETQSRLVIARLGFPAPRLQERRVLRSGRVAFADLYFPDHDHWCEIDGRAKYLDPRFLAGRRPEAALIDEKNRENEIRREVRAFSRWESMDAEHPRRLWDILTAAGLPTRRPRP